MALSNSQYDAIMREYGRRQMDGQHRMQQRRSRLYKEIPVIRKLEA